MARLFVVFVGVILAHHLQYFITEISGEPRRPSRVSENGISYDQQLWVNPATGADRAVWIPVEVDRREKPGSIGTVIILVPVVYDAHGAGSLSGARWRRFTIRFNGLPVTLLQVRIEFSIVEAAA